MAALALRIDTTAIAAGGVPRTVAAHDPTPSAEHLCESDQHRAIPGAIRASTMPGCSGTEYECGGKSQPFPRLGMHRRSRRLWSGSVSRTAPTMSRLRSSSAATDEIGWLRAVPAHWTVAHTDMRFPDISHSWEV